MNDELEKLKFKAMFKNKDNNKRIVCLLNRGLINTNRTLVDCKCSMFDFGSIIKKDIITFLILYEQYQYMPGIPPIGFPPAAGYSSFFPSTIIHLKLLILYTLLLSLNLQLRQHQLRQF